MRIVPRSVVVVVLSAVGAVCSPPSRARAADPVPSGDPRDRLLAERAVRVGRNTVARHLTPEGVLAYQHRPDATPAQLSADAVKMADTAIWTGCYAASLACRWHVTREPEALALCKRVAAGMDLLSRATGVEGCISRSVGRPIPGEDPGRETRASPLGDGLCYRGDPSRDSLTGLVLGWDFLARFCDDPEVHAVAVRNLGAIARRLYAGKMSIRDVDGKVTTYGELSAKSALIFENGMYSAIGLSAMLAALIWDKGDDLLRAWKKLDKDGWQDALDAQYLWLPAKVRSASNMNMTQMALTVICVEDLGKPKKLALSTMREFRRFTRGRQNGGYLALYLMSGNGLYRDEVREELRQTLTDMPPYERGWADTEVVKRFDLVPIARRQVVDWAWKVESISEQLITSASRPDPDMTFSRADWLFAYWLARGAGELAP